jgi:hypothetical protein
MANLISSRRPWGNRDVDLGDARLEGGARDESVRGPA